MNRLFSSDSGPGWLLILVGLSLNRWTLGWMLAPDGVIESGLFRGLIHLVDIGFILAGLTLLQQDAPSRYPMKILRPTLRRFREWTFARGSDHRPGIEVNRLLAPVLPWLVVGFFLITLEAAAYIVLRVKSPDQAKKTTRLHAVIGSPKRLLPGDVNERDIIALHPLYGWYYRGRTRSRDRYGFRVNNPSDTSALEPSSSLRVFLLGGSTAAGHGAPPEQSIAAHLERGLERRWTVNVNVVNAGVGGWASSHELAFLTGRILPFFDPDLVIVLDGVNDVKRAVVSGRRLRRSGTERDGFWISREDGYLHDPKLEFYRDRFEALKKNPLQVLNQLLYTLGIRRYLHPNHYFAGRLIGSTLAGEPAGRAVFDRKVQTINWTAPLKVTRRERRRIRQRLRSLPRRKQTALRRTLKRLSSRDAAVFRKMTGKAPRELWRQFRRDLPLSPDELEALVQYVIAPFQPEDVSEWLDSLPCAPLPVKVGPYLRNVRSAVAASRASDVPIVYALQPTLFQKRQRTFAEKMWMRNMRTCTYSGRCFPRFDLPFGTCLRGLFRRFRRKAGRAFRTRRFPDDPEAGVRVVDLSRLFADDRRHLFTDYVHYNGRANRTIARKLEDLITSMNLDGKRPSTPSDSP